MIYRNDNIIEKDDYVKGTLKDLKEYFKYQIASLCMSAKDYDYEEFRYNVENIMILLDNLYEDTDNEIYSDNDIVVVKVMAMGSFCILDEDEEE